MKRVLHLLDDADGTGEPLALRLSLDTALRGAPDERHAWLLLGGEAIRDAARGIGLDDHKVRLLPRPTGLGQWLPGACRRYAGLMGDADRVVCWTQGAAELAGRLGVGQAEPRFGQATLCGFAKGVIEGGLDDARDQSPGRAELRRRWGVDERVIVVALLADRPRRVNGRAALMCMAFAYEALTAARAECSDIRLLCHPWLARREEACELAELLQYPQLVMQDAQVLTPWRVLQGCDLALAPAPIHAGLSMLWADAMGVPVIAPGVPSLPAMDTLEHLMPATSGQAKRLADPMTRWALDHQHAAALC